MGVIRFCDPEDVPAVARLFQATFRDAGEAPSPALNAQLERIIFAHPWRDAELGARVYIGEDGELTGYMGAIPARMSLNGRPIQAAIASSLMVAEPARNPLVG